MNSEKKHIFDNPRSVQKVLYILFACLGISLALEPFIQKHPYFPWEEWLGFYAIYGLVACVLLVLGAKYILRPLVKRDEDHYD
jgi:hypothetical protein